MMDVRPGQEWRRIHTDHQETVYKAIVVDDIVEDNRDYIVPHSHLVTTYVGLVGHSQHDRNSFINVSPTKRLSMYLQIDLQGKFYPIWTKENPRTQHDFTISPRGIKGYWEFVGWPIPCSDCQNFCGQAC